MTLIDEILEGVYECKLQGIDADSMLVGGDKVNDIIHLFLSQNHSSKITGLVNLKDLTKDCPLLLLGLQVYRSPDFSGIKVFKK